MIVKTAVSFEDEEFGKSEELTYKREVEEYDLVDWLSYFSYVLEMYGHNHKCLNLIDNNGTFYTNED